MDAFNHAQTSNTQHHKRERLHANLRARLGVVGRTLRSALLNSLITGLVVGPRKLFLRYYREKKAAGQTLYVEDLPGARQLEHHEMAVFHQGPLPDGPPKYEHPFKSRIMRLGRYPDADYTFAYRKPPLSGRTLAGLGERTPRRTQKFFHAGMRHIYGAMNQAFQMVADESVFPRVLRARWDNRRTTGPIAVEKRDVSDPAAMADRLKAKSRALGAVGVGCTPVVETAVYAHVDEYLPHAIVVAAPMEREKMLHLPAPIGSYAVQNGYIDVGKIAIELATFIREMGWKAEADTNLGNGPSKVLHIPLAVNAGLGTMGRHTSLITPDHGANVRLATVLTDIPVAFDSPIDVGIEDYCMNCTVCAQNCPSGAIYKDKQMVRGVEKWHLDFDSCMPYFSENEGCGICLTVCPWSETERAPLLTALMQQRRKVQKAYPQPLPPEDRLIVASDVRSPDPTRDVQPEAYWRDVVVVSRKDHPGPVAEIVLGPLPGEPDLPEWAAGAHTELLLPSGIIRAYSLSNCVGDHDGYRLGVKLDAKSKGGSAEVHSLQPGDRLRANRPGNNFPIRYKDGYAYLAAGGIGVTPMVPMARELHARGIPFEVHYAVNSPEQAVFGDELKALAGDRYFLHLERTWLGTVFDKRPNDAGVYACGPIGFMNAVRQKAIESGLPNSQVYSEDFGSPNPDTQFDVVLGSSGARVTVAPGESIQRALQRHGVYLPVACGYGICGTCTVGVLQGEPDARDKVFSKEAQKTKITTCCSRSFSDELVIDL